MMQEVAALHAATGTNPRTVVPYSGHFGENEPAMLSASDDYPSVCDLTSLRQPDQVQADRQTRPISDRHFMLA